MKPLVRILVIPIFFLGVISCSNYNSSTPYTPPVTYTTFSATLTGNSETPPNTSTATGDATLVFNNSTKKFTLTVNYSGLTPISGHVHKGAVGVAGDILFPLTISPSPIQFTSPALTSAQESDLMAGLYYVNLHTNAYPNGEIRGQLTQKASPSPSPNPNPNPNPNPGPY